MSTLVMLPMPNQIAHLLRQDLWRRKQLLGEPRVPKRLVDVCLPLPVVVEARLLLDAKELAIRENAARKRVRKPVQRHGLENRVAAGILVRPLEELLANPRQQRERAACQHEANGRGPCAVFFGIRGAVLDPFAAALHGCRFGLVDGAWGDFAGAGTNAAHVDVCGFAGGEVGSKDACDTAADVSALGYVAGEAERVEECVHDAGNVAGLEGLVRWWIRRERVANERRCYQMIWKIFRSVFVLHDVQHGEEFKKAACFDVNLLVLKHWYTITHLASRGT